MSGQNFKQGLGWHFFLKVIFIINYLSNFGNIIIFCKYYEMARNVKLAFHGSWLRISLKISEADFSQAFAWKRMSLKQDIDWRGYQANRLTLLKPFASCEPIYGQYFLRSRQIETIEGWISPSQPFPWLEAIGGRISPQPGTNFWNKISLSAFTKGCFYLETTFNIK